MKINISIKYLQSEDFDLVVAVKQLHKIKLCLKECGSGDNSKKILKTAEKMVKNLEISALFESEDGPVCLKKNLCIKILSKPPRSSSKSAFISQYCIVQ